MRLSEIARAKVNLTLRVLGRRADGYHELESLVTFAAAHDVVTLEPGADGSVVVTGPFAQYIGGDNLLIRLLALLRDTAPGLRLGSVRLDKNLPIAAGLGGGSADAAALLRAVQRANPERAGALPWREIAGRIGADVPVCLANRPALVAGKGDEVVPVRLLPEVNAVLVNPRLPLPTAQVFAALRAGPAPPAAASASPGPPLELAGLQDLLAYAGARGNALERPAAELVPAVGAIKAALAAQPDCRLAAMSGSGPTCFGVFPDRAAAERAAAAIAGAHSDWWVVSTLLAGARP
jgi:4-diphosphocytidyl-2-C-methyl-D-erythritol kinase